MKSRAWPVVLLSLAGAAAAQPASRPTPPTPSPAAPQDPERSESTPLDRELEALLADVTEAHGGETPLRSTEEFEGTLQIRSPDEEQDITVGLNIRFKKPSSIRYMVDDHDGRKERGRDARGGWLRIGTDEPAESLGGHEYEGDREQLAKHVRLAEQILRFLDPAAIGALLEAPEIGRDRLGRHDCLVIRGTAPSFPLYTGGGELAKVSLALFVDAASSRLIAVEAHPFGESGAPSPAGELISLDGHRLLEGKVLVPTDIHVFAVTPQAPRELVAHVRVMALDLDPDLGEEKFDRRRPW